VGEGTLQLTNNDCDTGHTTRLGEYALGDATYARLVEELFKRGFGPVNSVRASALSLVWGVSPFANRIREGMVQLARGLAVFRGPICLAAEVG
jgi:hypothetical protein